MTNPWSQPIQQVWFDLDGTLLGSRKFLSHLLFVVHYLRFMRPFHRTLPALALLREMRKAIEYPNPEDIAQNCERSLKIFESAAKQTVSYHSLLQQIFVKMRPGFFPIPAARDLLFRTMKSQRPVILATNPVWPLDIVNMRLSWGGMTGEQFHFISCGENMRHSKKSPAYYRELLEKTAADPRQTLHIGDSFHKDAHAAIHGLRVFLITPWFKKPWRHWQIKRSNLPNNYIRIGSLRDLASLLEES